MSYVGKIISDIIQTTSDLFSSTCNLLENRCLCKHLNFRQDSVNQCFASLGNCFCVSLAVSSLSCLPVYTTNGANILRHLLYTFMLLLKNAAVLHRLALYELFGVVGDEKFLVCAYHGHRNLAVGGGYNLVRAKVYVVLLLVKLYAEVFKPFERIAAH